MWLIQRMKERGFPNDAKGVDALFRFDYMGSAEFEFGTLPKALKEMRADSQKVVITKVEARVGKGKKHKAYFVGPACKEKDAGKLFSDEISGRNSISHKEMTYIRQSYIPERNKDYWKGIVGWWVLDSDPPWALFKTDALARKWFEAVWPTCKTKKGGGDEKTPVSK